MPNRHTRRRSWGTFSTTVRGTVTSQIISALKPLAVPLDSLTQLEGNPRKGVPEAVAASLARFGQRKPIVVRASDRQIIAGNHTWLAAQALGWDEIAAVLVDDDTATSQAFALADNRTAELGGYDEALLLELIRQVGEADAEMLLDTGWDEESIAELVERIEPGVPQVLPPDAAPSAPKTPHSKPADVWVLGRHRVACGDSTDIGTYRTLMLDAEADLVMTDPPYNVAYEGKTKDALQIENDSMSTDDFALFLAAAYQPMFEVTRPGGAIYVFHADSSGETFRRTMVEAGFYLKQVLVWVKDRFVLGRQDYQWQHEPILYGWKPGAAHTWRSDRSQKTVIDDQTDLASLSREEMLAHLTALYRETSVIRESKPIRNGEHPTMKPIVLVARLISNSSRAGDIVLDPFGGSGSTLMACEYTGRKARLIELDPRYVDVICRRWQEHTGSLPILERTGKPHDFTKG